MTGAQLKDTLIRQRITQERFALAIGVNPRTLRTWISGQAPMPLYVDLICESLEYLTLEELGANKEDGK